MKAVGSTEGRCAALANGTTPSTLIAMQIRMTRRSPSRAAAWPVTSLPAMEPTEYTATAANTSDGEKPRSLFSSAG